VYNFIVGVKTPTIYDYDVKGKLLIRMEGTQGTLSINLAVTSRIPEIKCLK
jgi:tRNA A-37 threonylcarbamoyl transferase component Bud32